MQLGFTSLVFALPLVAATLVTATPARAQEAADDDGVRFRGGISGGGGGLFVAGFALGLGGLDGRLGVQITDLIGVYVQPQLALYGGTFNFGSVSATGVGGIAGGTAVVDFTFIDQLFVGAGGGYAVINNPHGPEIHFRAGGYPLFGFGEDNIRRKGLMLSADVRLFIASGEVFVSPTGNIGYEAF